MLISKNLEDRTYKEILAEAIMQIPLYSSEWTNYNPSDPGITILENLTAFEILQQSSINQVTPLVKQKLLQMAGFEGKKGRCARMLLVAEHAGRRLYLPANQRFMLGDISYETNRKMILEDYRLVGIYGKKSDTFTDYSYLADESIPLAAEVFGDEPSAGDSLYFAINKPIASGEEIIFYITVANCHNRNPFEEKGKNIFANIRYECYTKNGYETIYVNDDTGCFLVNGELRMRIPKTEMAVCPELEGEKYCIRAVLENADYDIPPRLINVESFLFEVWQKESCSGIVTFQSPSKVSVSGELALNGFVQVFCREEKGASYHLYNEMLTKKDTGRLYEKRRETDEYGQPMDIYTFDNLRFGYAPLKVRNCVRIVAYTESMMRQYAIGKVYGYDAQEIQLPVKNIVAASFSVIAKRILSDGDEIYDFVSPNHYGESDLTYHLLENEGKLVIEDAGDFIGAELYIASCSVTKGSDGNVREGNNFVAEGALKSIIFTNPGPGTGGCSRESIQDVKQRFMEDMNTPYTAVTPADYERLVRNTPGLCIKKVHAVYKEADGAVHIVVMPDTDKELPKLSDTYMRLLRERVEERRLLATRIKIEGARYLPINVNAIVYVKGHYDDAREIITKRITQSIDYINNDKSFGEVLKFGEVFRDIEELDCVEYIHDMLLYPQLSELAVIKENNIIPAYNCLCYIGNISLELRTYHR